MKIRVSGRQKSVNRGELTKKKIGYEYFLFSTTGERMKFDTKNEYDANKIGLHIKRTTCTRSYYNVNGIYIVSQKNKTLNSCP